MRWYPFAFLVASLALPLDATSQAAFIARCGEPTGIRFEQVDGELRQQADGFPGVNPTFMITNEAPRRLTFLWGPAAWARDAQKLMDNLQDADIILSTADVITAMRIDNGGGTHLYSLFPKRGLLQFTQHRLAEPKAGGAAAASTFHAKCEFSN